MTFRGWATYVQPLWGELQATTRSFSPQRTGSAGRDGTGTTGHQLESACVLKFQKHVCYAKKPSRLSPNFLPIRGIQRFRKATPHRMAQPFQSQTLLSCSPEQKALGPKEWTPKRTSYFTLIHFKAAFFKGHHFLFWHIIPMISINRFPTNCSVKSAGWLDFSESIKPISSFPGKQPRQPSERAKRSSWQRHATRPFLFLCLPVKADRTCESACQCVDSGRPGSCTQKAESLSAYPVHLGRPEIPILPGNQRLIVSTASEPILKRRQGVRIHGAGAGSETDPGRQREVWKTAGPLSLGRRPFFE